jgi:hypothetical protein
MRKKIRSLAVLALGAIALQPILADAAWSAGGVESGEERAEIDIDAWGLDAVSINLPGIITGYVALYTPQGSQDVEILLYKEATSLACVEHTSFPGRVEANENPDREEEEVLDGYLEDGCNPRDGFATWVVRWAEYGVLVRVAGTASGNDVATCFEDVFDLCSPDRDDATVDIEVIPGRQVEPGS